MMSVRMQWLGRRTGICLVSTLAMCAVMLGGASAAWAQDGGVGAAAVPQFPPSVTVGAQDVPVSLLLRNTSTGEYADDTFNIDQITLTPSCGSKLGFGTCPAGGEDPGVFVPSATGVGRAGTSCAGQTFNITLLDPVTGRYLFTPTTPATLGPTDTAAGTCIIDFTVDVARAPTKDSDPAQAVPGLLQTDQYASVSLTDITPGNTFGQNGTGTGSDETTVLQAPAQIVTAVNDATITLSDNFTDTATVSGPAGGPTPTGTVNFFVYGPNDATCAGAPVFSSLTRPLSAAGTATSGAFTPIAAGTYRVIAVYSGDLNYTTVSGACNDANETVVVAPATPRIVTAVNDATLTLGEGFTDTAIVSGTAGQPTPTGTVSFFVYGPNNATCTGAPVASSLNRPLTAGTAASAAFTPSAAGTYRVIAVYNGDANYTTVSGNCNDANETTVVAQVTPTIVTQVSAATINPGGTFTDTATVSGPAGAATPTGTVTFNVYGPNNATCTGTPVLTSTNRPLNAAGTATSGTFTPAASGTYRVIAVYNGDANYNPVSGNCNDFNETVVVRPAPQIQVTKDVTPAQRVVPGGNFTYTLVVSNPSTTTPVTIISLNDDKFGNLLTRTGENTCRDLANFVLATGASRTCTFVAPVTSQTPITHTNIVTVLGRDQFGNEVTDTDDAVVLISPVPQIAVTKDASPASRPVPGGNFTYTVVVSNPSTTTPIRIVSLVDNRFGNLATRAGENTCDDLIGVVLATGASRTCTFVAPVESATPITHTNTVTVLGRDERGNEVTANDDATVTLTALPVNPPPPPPPTTPPPPAQQIAAETTPPSGTAAITGKTGCVYVPFNVLVRGRQIARVVFTLDGRVVRTLTRPNSGNRFKYLVNPRTLSRGQHRVQARITFRSQSGTRPRTLRVVFSRCGRVASQPRFTG